MIDFLDRVIKFLDQPLIVLSETTVITWLQVIIAFSLIVFSWVMSKFISKRLVSSLFKHTKMQKDSIILLQKIVFIVLIIVVVLLVLSYLKIPLTAFAFISGAVAIGFGFGAKVIIENYLSGWILMSERPIRTNDIIDTDGNVGRVIGIGNRSTTIRRIDGAHLVIPNSQILESKLINLTLIDPNLRTSVRVGASYGSDINLIKQLLLKVANENEHIINESSPLVVFEDFGDNALIFDLFFWVVIGTSKELREIRSDIRFAISHIFAEHKITIAFPQRDVHLHIPDNQSMTLQNGDKND
ncbi:MAG: mechanosensitive ion channel family protein [Marinicellaceae bacterium]